MTLADWTILLDVLVADWTVLVCLNDGKPATLRGCIFCVAILAANVVVISLLSKSV